MLTYLCHPFYLLLASPFAPKGQTSISNEGEIEGFALQLRTKSKHKATFYLTFYLGAANLSISPSIWAQPTFLSHLA
jgi:hypothetical protein